jgi:hypothetical protein
LTTRTVEAASLACRRSGLLVLGALAWLRIEEAAGTEWPRAVGRQRMRALPAGMPR